MQMLNIHLPLPPNEFYDDDDDTNNNYCQCWQYQQYNMELTHYGYFFYYTENSQHAMSSLHDFHLNIEHLVSPSSQELGVMSDIDFFI